MKLCRHALGFLLALSAAAGAEEKSESINYETARFERRLVAKRTLTPIAIDGVLSEADWKDAPVATGFIQNDPHEGEPATHDTEVRVLYDADNLYFGVLAHDAEPSRIIVNDITRDFNTRSGDVFGLVLDTFHDERNGFMFETNPAGAMFDAQFVNEGREFNQNWDGVWYVKSRITEDGWETEMAIPFKTVRFQDLDDQTWGLNFVRRTRRLNEDSYWAPLPRIYRFTRLSLAGTLEDLDGLQPRRDIKVTPYAKADASDSALLTELEGNFAAGVDAKLGIGTGLRLDLTVHTDFSEVEADVQQINLSRFSLFFPEKRDFFLENSGLFWFGTPQDQRLSQFQASFGTAGSSSNLRGGQSRGEDLIFFFSRRVGLSEAGLPIPVIGGARFTGRAGDYDIGLLNIQTGEAPELTGLAANGDNFTVARVRRNVFENSDIGVIFIDRENMETDHYNRGYGFDANFKLTQTVSLNGYVAKTASPNLSGDDLAGRAAWGYEGRLFEIRNAVSTLQDHFNPEVGFAPRLGVKRSSNFLGYHYRPSWWTGFLREINPHVEFEYFADQSNVVVSKYLNYHFAFELQNGGLFEWGLNTNVEQPQVDFPIYPGVVIPPGYYDFNEWFAFLFTDTSRTLSANFRIATGDFYSGDKQSASAGAVLKLGEKFSAQADWSYNDITLVEGAFRTHLLTTRFAYNFSTRMFLNGLVQYNSVAKEWNSNIRFNFIHHPLSDLFIVYNDLRDDLGLMKNRALIVKYTQLLSF
jgi:hypothetical protein